jgi:hypothetical protein
MTAGDDDVAISTGSQAFDVTAVVRTFTGIYECQLIGSSWTCSCGKAQCSHVAQVEMELGN